MSMSFILHLCLVLAATADANANQPASRKGQPASLDRTVTAEHPISLHGVPPEQLVSSRLSILSKVTGLLVGFEGSTAPAPATRTSPAGDLRGIKAREALNRLVAADSRYEWREMDGVVVVRPVGAWTECSHFMNRIVDVPGGDVAGPEVIAMLFRLIDPTIPQGRPLPGARPQRFPVRPFKGPLLEALNHLARSGRHSWRLTYGSEQTDDAREVSITLAPLNGAQTGFSTTLRLMPAECGRGASIR